MNPPRLSMSFASQDEFTLARFGITAMFLFALAACGGSGDDSTTAVPGSPQVGTSGGTVTGPDGSTVVVPTGALQEDIKIAIAKNAETAPTQLLGESFQPVSNVFTITPHGQTFAEPVQVTLPIDRAQVAEGDQLVVLKAQPFGEWAVYTNTTVGDASVSVPVREFSVFVVARRTKPAPFRFTASVSGSSPNLTITYQFSGTRPECTQGEQLKTVFMLDHRWQLGAGLNISVHQEVFEQLVVPVPSLPPAGEDLTTVTHTVQQPLHIPSGALDGPGGGSSSNIPMVEGRYSCRGERLPSGEIGTASWTQLSENRPQLPPYSGNIALLTDIPPIQTIEGVVTQSSARVQIRDAGQTGALMQLSKWEISRDDGATWNLLATPETPVPDSTVYDAAIAANAGIFRLTASLPAFAAADDGARVRVTACMPSWVDPWLTQPLCVVGMPQTVTLVSTAVPPAFSAEPDSVVVVAGTGVSFSVAVTGIPAPTLQWQRRNGNGTWSDIASGQTATFNLATTTAADDGAQFRVVATSSSGSATSQVATLNVVDLAAPPVASAISGSLTVAEGGSAVFAATVNGTAPLSFQWRRNGVAIVGANTPLLRLDNVSPASAGDYVLEIGNPAGTTQTQAQQLTVVPTTAAPVVPVIVTQPASVSAVAGGTATFNVGAIGGNDFRYQWMRNNVAIAGATSASYTTPALSLTDDGALYAVIVYNGAGLIFSTSAQLTVTSAPVAPSLVQQPADRTVVAGSSQTVSAAFAGTPPFTVRVEQWVGVSWQQIGGDLTIEDNGLHDVLVLAPLDADVGTQWQIRFVAENAAGGVISDDFTVTIVAPGMAIYAGHFISGGGGGAADGTGTAARFDTPEALLADAAGNLYVAQSNAARVARIAPGAVATTIYAPGIVAGTNFGALALGPDGSLYAAGISWCGLHKITAPTSASPAGQAIPLQGCTGSQTRGLAVSTTGVVHLPFRDANAVARIGGTPENGYYPATVFVGAENVYVAPGSTDATGTAARFNQPRGIAFAQNGDLFVADTDNHTIRRVTPAGVVTTFAGSAGQVGTIDATGASARFNRPSALGFDPNGNLIVLQLGDNDANAIVRRITPGGVVTTLFNAHDEAVALAAEDEKPFAAVIRGLAVLDANRIAITAGNAVLVRAMP